MACNMKKEVEELWLTLVEDSKYWQAQVAYFKNRNENMKNLAEIAQNKMDDLVYKVQHLLQLLEGSKI